MCSIYTIDYSFYLGNISAVEATLRQQANHNPHGISALFLGVSDSTFIQCESIEAVLVLMNTVQFDRVFIHCRFATSLNKGLQNCHGFRAIDNTSDSPGYYVFHNGILYSDKSNNYRVDSIYIAELIRVAGIDTALAYLHTEPYTNCLIVNPDGNWTMHRSESGTLYTDGHFNYSTTVCGAISIPVPQYTQDSYKLDLTDYSKPIAAVTENSYVPSSMLSKYWSEVDELIESEEVNDLNYPDFLDWVYDNGFEEAKVPKDIYQGLNAEKRDWLKIVRREERYAI